MNNFELAFNFTFREEGGYINDPNDSGGGTKFGISRATYPHLDISNLTAQQAKDIYYNDYWLDAQCDKMPFSIALSLFDFAFNSGLPNAAPILQITMGVSSDGIIGDQTLAAIDENKFLNYNTYRILYLIHRKNFNDYGKGWTGRVLRLVSYITLHGGAQ